MSPHASDLLARLEVYYRRAGWPVRRADAETLEATGPGGVLWLGTAVIDDELESEQLEERILGLADRRMPGGGELCPLDVVVAEGSEGRLRELLARLGLADCPHISVLSPAAG
jgi:hypothetical protein